MGSAASANTERQSSHDGHVEGAAQKAEGEFDARAKLLASKYHDLCLRSGGDVSGEGRAASATLVKNEVVTSTGLSSGSSLSPLPRAEHRRLLSNQLRPDGAIEHTKNDRVTPTVAISRAARR